jgi:hypothetical protein
LSSKTGEIKAAEFKIDAVNLQTLRLALSHRRKVIKKPDCTYVAALNIKNAFKRLGIRVNIIKDKNIIVLVVADERPPRLVVIDAR